MTREEALLAIVKFDHNKDEAFSQLAKYPRECPQPLVEITPEILINNLKLYVKNTITTDDLEFWAGLIDIREDIAIKQVEGEVYALANPDLIGEISVEKITKLINLLEPS